MPAHAAPNEGICDRLVVSLVSLFAIWTVAAQSAQLARWTFHQLVIVGAILVGLGSVYACWWVSRGGGLADVAGPGEGPARDAARTRSAAIRSVSIRPVSIRLGLLVLCASAGLVSLLVSRPDMDDVGYVSRAVYFLEHPHVSLDLAYHDHWMLEFPTEYPLMLAYSLELSWAALSYVTQVPFVTLYYSVGSALGGALIPAVTYMAVSRFVERPEYVFLGCVAIVAFLCVDGSTHRTFGSFAFVRIWQGKVMLMAVALPAFIALSVDWLRRPSWVGWLRLGSMGIAASGLSGTAFFLLPALSLWLAAGHILERGLSHDVFRRVVGYGSSLLYLVGIAFTVWLSTSRAEFEYLGFSVFPETFLGQASLVLGGALPLTGIAMAVAAISVFLLPPGSRRFFSGWILAALVLALNPLAMPVLMDGLTTTNAYWRLFFTLPFPLLIGVIAGSLAGRYEFSADTVIRAAAAIVLLAAGLQFFPAAKTPLGGQRFALGPKLAPALLAHVKAIAARAEPGSMLAPVHVSSMMPILTSAHPQAVVRGYLLRHFAAQAGVPEIAESRIRAAAAVTARKTEALADVEELLEQGIENVVCTRKASKNKKLRRSLHESGLEVALRTPRYVLFTRSGERL